MDSITRTAQSAVVSYYNTLRRMGSIHRQDKNKLLVLWFFHYLKNRSDFLWKWDKQAGEFKVDRELESYLEKRFRCNIPCLTDASCFIKLLPEDNCIPLLEILWNSDDEDEISYTVLVTNATQPLGDDNGYEIDDIQEIVDEIPWTNSSNFIIPNAEDTDAVDTFITSNNN